jgi:RNAse (barnase) inhibitor barstar
MLFKSTFLLLLAFLFSFQVMAAGSVLIDGKAIKNREQLHTVFAKELNFPHYYGKTLDSLYDTLSTDYSGGSIIKIKHLNILKARLSSEYVEALVQAIIEAAKENSRVILVLE